MSWCRKGESCRDPQVRNVGGALDCVPGACGRAVTGLGVGMRGALRPGCGTGPQATCGLCLSWRREDGLTKTASGLFLTGQRAVGKPGSPPAPAFLSGTHGPHVSTGHLCFGPRAVVLVSSADRTQRHRRGRDCCVFSERTSHHPPKNTSQAPDRQPGFGKPGRSDEIKSALKNQQKVKV